VLSVEQAHILLFFGELERVENLLRDAERWLDTTAEKSERPVASSAETRSESFDNAQDKLRRRMIVVDKEEFRRLPGAIAIARAGLSLTRGDVAGTMTYARRTLDVAPEDDHVTRGGAAGFLGLAYWTSGDLESAHRTFAVGMASLQKAGNISDAINGATTLAAIRITQGRLHDAMHTYEQALQLAMERGTPTLRGTADMYMGMSDLHREHNDLHAATQCLLKSKEMGEHTGFPQNRYRWHITMARVREAQGDLHGALDLLDEAERLYMSDFSPNVRPISALKAGVWIKQGELEKTLDWARERNLSIEEAPSYLREFEQITFARILLSQYQSDGSISLLHDAMGLLERLLKAADEGGRMGSVIEILVLQALAHQMQEEIPAALTSLERALKLAEPEGYMRIFLSEGSNMAELIREIAKRGFSPNYTGKLLSEFEAERKGLDVETPPSTSPASSSLIEPLSQRELDILRLFKTELSGPEIAQELVIALSTVRTHTKSIYNKLNVNSRRGAVKRAIELGLI
jgi:LuxR family maltose regulon positive regulatory protein